MIFENKFFAATGVTPFSYRQESTFFTEASRVYEALQNMTTNQRKKSAYWVGNEFGNNSVRNVSKVLSGAIMNKNVKLDEATMLYLKGASMIFDGNIAVWRNKFETNLVRPAAYVKEGLDKKWLPALGGSYSPAFPSLAATLAGGICSLIQDEIGENITTPFSTSQIPVANFKSELISAEITGGTYFAMSAESGYDLGEKIMENTMEFDF